MPIEGILTTEQRIMATIEPRTPAGLPAAVDGDPAWSVESGTCTLQPVEPPDPMRRWIVSGTPGDSVVLVEADADLGEGFTAISDTFLVHVANPQAASLNAALGEPELKP